MIINKRRHKRTIQGKNDKTWRVDKMFHRREEATSLLHSPYQLNQNHILSITMLSPCI
jgi:hypothetical protein